MKLKVVKSRALPIGIDLGSASVKVAQLRRSGEQIELTAAALLETPPNQRITGSRTDFLAQELRQLLQNREFKGRECILSLPASQVFIQHVRMPRQSPSDLTKALRAELADKLPFDVSTAIIRSVVAGELYNEKDMMEVIAFAASQPAVEEQLELAHRCRLVPVGVDVAPCAILECFARLFRRGEDAEHPTMFIDLGQSNTQVVVAQGMKMVFARSLPLGSCDLEKSAAARLKVEPAQVDLLRRKLAAAGEKPAYAEQLYEAMGESLENLVLEIRKCVHYYDSVFPSRPVERALFLGGQALDRRLCQNIAQRLNMPACVGDPLARVERSDSTQADLGMDRRQAQPNWAVAVGLGLGAEIVQAA
jgi:type IV pilus assembly protein PilM